MPSFTDSTLRNRIAHLMWLLSTDRAELHYFSHPSQVKGGYAILSHVWDDSEWSFQDIQRLRERCNTDGTVPRDHASEKIRQCCIIANDVLESRQ